MSSVDGHQSYIKKEIWELGCLRGPPESGWNPLPDDPFGSPESTAAGILCRGGAGTLCGQGLERNPLIPAGFRIHLQAVYLASVKSCFERVLINRNGKFTKKMSLQNTEMLLPPFLLPALYPRKAGRETKSPKRKRKVSLSTHLPCTQDQLADRRPWKIRTLDLR